MSDQPLAPFWLPIGLGLLGFVEPCSIGSTLLFIKYLEGRSAAAKVTHAVVFLVVRATLLGVLGIAAATIGTAFIGWQRAAWIALGLLYAAIGALYLARRSAMLRFTVGARPRRGRYAWGSAGLGVLFGLNVPACATPLLLALFAGVAARATAGATLAAGFASVALFGASLSLPLAVAVLVPAGRRALDWLAGVSARVPRVTGVALLVLGAWSILTALRAQ